MQLFSADARARVFKKNETFLFSKVAPNRPPIFFLVLPKISPNLIFSFKNDFPPLWARWRLSSVRIVSCINLFTQYRDGNERHTYILDPSVTEHFPLLFFLLSVLKPNYFVSNNCWSLTFSERKCALYKAKLFQEAMFFIVIFTYLKQIYSSQMAIEYSAG